VSDLPGGELVMFYVSKAMNNSWSEGIVSNNRIMIVWLGHKPRDITQHTQHDTTPVLLSISILKHI
jgi:hypothetical protein